MKTLAALVALSFGLAAHSSPVPTNPNVTPHDPLPARVLDCGAAIITAIGDRFQGTPNADTGTSVTLNNGGYVTSYDLVPSISNSKVVQHVFVCLMYIPDPAKCPPGDKRGRVYTMTNLTTLESWTLSDSEHMCGGA